MKMTMKKDEDEEICRRIEEHLMVVTIIQTKKPSTMTVEK